MAEDEASAEPIPRNPWEYLHASPEARRRYHDAVVAEKRANIAALGASLIERIEKRMRSLHSLRSADGQAAPERYARHPERPKEWQGPHRGKTFDHADALRAATEEECAAGFKATWGYEMTPKHREPFQIFIFDAGAGGPSELEAREIYSRLQIALRDAEAFGARHYRQGDAPATIALAELWGTLPTLPPLADLPGYVKTESDRARLVHEWQGMARQNLGRDLTGRELAELSVVLGVSNPPYATLLKEKGRMSPAQVIDWEKKRLDKVR